VRPEGLSKLKKNHLIESQTRYRSMYYPPISEPSASILNIPAQFPGKTTQGMGGA
jgi:hypothetical protein